MSLDKINELVAAVAKLIENNEKVAIPVLSAKLQKVASIHPYDKTVVELAHVFSKMADNNKLFITRSELVNLYNKFYTVNTKFAEYFSDELGPVNNLKAAHVIEKTAPAIVKTHERFADPILTNALASAFDKNIPLKLYSEESANKAKNIVASNLDAWGLRASKLVVDAGNEYFIIVRADYNTPKGITSILIPVEMQKGKVAEPQVFMCSAGPQELNHKNIKSYLTANAGALLKVQATDVLFVLTKTATKNDPVTSIDLAMTKLASTKEHGGDFGSIIGQKMWDAPKKDISVPRLPEADLFAKKFASADGVAEFKFGHDILNIGRDVIARTLAGFGIKNPQIAVVGSDDSTVAYGVSLFGGKTAFRVPVKISNNRVLNPEILICNGSIGSFSKETISELFSDSSIDSKVVAATSAQHGLSSIELVKNVKEAVAESNFEKAEDALNVLKQSGNEVAYKEGFIAYINTITAQKTASAKSKCSMIVNSSSSSHPVCGHTNLPIHKVYQDEHGNCLPAYRKGITAADSQAYFMNAKIFG